MKLRFHFLLSVFSFLLSMPGLLLAGPDISGSSRYQFGANNATVSFGCDKLRNTSSENATGTLMVRLWAMDAPYQGGTLRGHQLASYRLEPLDGGMAYTKLSKSVACTLPTTRKAWHLCMTVSEFNNGGYTIADYANFADTVVLGTPPRQFTLAGPWTWQVSDDYANVDMNVAKISHTRTGDTGSLRLSLWATKAPYQGGQIKGYQIGAVQKKALKPGYNYTKVNNRAKYVKPPAGSYYVSLVLLEYDGDEYVIKAWLPGAKKAAFK